MKKNSKFICSVVLYILFFVYIFLLVYLLLISRLGYRWARSYNLIPFYTINSYMSQIKSFSSGFAVTNILGNIVAFIPLGLYLPILQKNKKIIFNLGIVFLFSLFAEILQWLLKAGALDIDDLILNVLGGFLGLITYKILFLLFKQEHRVRLFTAAGSVVAGTMFFLSRYYL